MKRINSYSKFLIESRKGVMVKLSDVYDNYPDKDEIIWNFISQDDFENEIFPVETENPLEIFNKENDNGESIKDTLEFATDEQLNLISYYRDNIEDIKDDYIIMYGDTLVDGYHRITAMALEGVESVKAVKL